MAQLPSVLKFVFSDAVTGTCIVAIIANLLFPMKDAADIAKAKEFYAKDGVEDVANIFMNKAAVSALEARVKLYMKDCKKATEHLLQFTR